MESLLSADVDTFKAACVADLAAAREALASFKALPEDSSLLDVLKGHDAIGHPLNRSAGLTHLFFQVHPDASMREAAAEIEQDVSRFGTELSLDREVYDRLAGLDAERAPDAVTRRMIKHALRDFRRSGVDRDEAVRDRVRTLQEELVEVGQSFSRNIAGDVREITLDSAANLDGLPADFIGNHPPGEDGLIHITTNPPDLMPMMKFCRDRESRRALFMEFSRRGAPANFSVLDDLLAKRHELATLLGYPSWAAYATEDKMIKTAERAGDFIQRVADLTVDRASQEMEDLTAAIQIEHPGSVLHDYDRAYAIEGVRRERYAFDSREARPYFRYEAVRDGIVDVIGRLYGLHIRRIEGAALWHDDVEAWEIVEEGEVLARFYLDMHPREDKFKHAAMFDLQRGLLGDAAGSDCDRVIPSACLVCNFPRPDAENPALLDPSDVRTAFHEFGHLLHHLLAGRHAWLATSGIATEWDFVEVPSQLFEEWSQDAKVLQSFALHHETGEPIPVELVERMNQASEYGKGVLTRNQVFYAALSLEYYSQDPEGRDTTAVLRETRDRYISTPFEEGTSMQTAFGHLDGYTALYYTYMWSLVLAKDCLSVFGDDLMNAEAARRYREAVLEPGGSRDAEDLMQDFLGRPYAFDAFEAWLAS